MALITEAQMRVITRKIAKADPVFSDLVKRSELCTIGRKRNSQSHYETLVDSIISQQLSIKAADSIARRLRELAGGKIRPEFISKLDSDQIRSCGLSNAKVRAINELTTATLDKTINFHKFRYMTNDDISEELVSLWGIGRWTVEMFLMFHLGRLDVWPVGDLGVRRGWEKLHSLPEQIEPKALDELGSNFAGFQSVVAWYCWRALEMETA
ncbi:MAG: hypothetical protein WCO08_00580 [Actinomycetes bacterium]